MNFEKPLIIAHRGASASAPENTFAAFQKAIDNGADGIEFDVRLSKDGIPVVFHDADLRRLAKIKNRVADLTAEELSRIDVGSWFNKAFPNRADSRFSAETIPTLKQLLDFLSGCKGLIYIELKGKETITAELAEAVCNLIKRTNLLPNIIVKSFKLEGVKIAKQLLPEVRTAALFEPKVLTILRKKTQILEAARKYNADEISIHYSLATEKFVRKAREMGFSIVIWTADNPVWVKRAFDFGIKAIITNTPAQILAERDEILNKSNA
ncbi:MAG: hypothetical protein LH472_07415 [Pyrinomonadaceae bacterium]|nr:hypothetical protein [Pyrinomonadaceae bacterium]